MGLGTASAIPSPACQEPLPSIAWVTMIEAFAYVAGWQQLYQLWELIVMACKFLWDLLRLLGGGG